MVEEDTSPLPSQQGRQKVHSGGSWHFSVFLCLGSWLSNATGPKLAASQSYRKQNAKGHQTKFLDHAATHPDAIITYQASHMVLAAHSNTAYLSESKARSRADGHFFMSEDDEEPHNNGAVLTVSQIVKVLQCVPSHARRVTWWWASTSWIYRFDYELYWSSTTLFFFIFQSHEYFKLILAIPFRLRTWSM